MGSPSPQPPPLPTMGPLRGANIGCADVLGCAASPRHCEGAGEPIDIVR
jgi:hypothetical protein